MSKSAKNKYDLMGKFGHTDTSDVSFRIAQCWEADGGSVLDLAYTGSDCLERLLSHPSVDKLRDVLRFLFVSNCGLTSLPDLSIFRNLEVLDLSCNQLREIRNLPKNLRELTCSHNQIKQIECGSELQRLKCEWNKLQHLDIPRTLVVLQCNDNMLRSISACPEAKKVYICNNPITRLIAPKVEHLECNRTKIQDITDFQNLQTIEMLDSGVQTIPHIRTLRTVICRKGQISTVSEKLNIGNIILNKKDVMEINIHD